MKGWLLDAYPLDGKMVVWLKQESGKAVRLEDSWTHSIFLAASKEDLDYPLQDAGCKSFIKSHERASRFERITDLEKSEVLAMALKDSDRATKLARLIESHGSFGRFRLYNVDVLPAQAYFYEHELFPLAFCDVTEGSQLKWDLLDSVWSTDYKLPELKIMYVGVGLEKQGRLPRFTDKIENVTVKLDEKCRLEGESEAETLKALNAEVERLDPDFILTHEGDSFLFPYLIHRAEVNGVSLALGREKTALKKPGREGTSYFSYGRIHFKPSAVKLQGRIHIDTTNSFTVDETGLQGLYEVARICRLPLHTASRASIGKCLSSLQFYHATKSDVLIPWKPTVAEHFKTYGELLIADRGGFIFEPRIGVFERVAELDFASLYPSIMYQKNVSAETVRCKCCPESKNRVPELDYNICEKRQGVVPKALEIVLKKRARYKELKKNATDASLRAIYDSRQTALKWINVTSFGYLGFNNAKFGRIDAHIAVCAFDRQLLLQATRIAEKHGFRVLHGIVDSLWLQKHSAKAEGYVTLKEDIESETGFSISFEGVYKWIVFLESRENSELPVANRYFGAFDDGTLKIRGIEARRHDTPALFARFQEEILKIMASGNSIVQVRSLMGDVEKAFQDCARAIRQGDVEIADLAFTKQLSKDAGAYQNRNTIEVNSMSQLREEGKVLRAGQVMRYVIKDYGRRETIPLEFIDGRSSYDAEKYVAMLADVSNTVTKPFGYAVNL
jgi:DNA polymerase, archaea type